MNQKSITTFIRKHVRDFESTVLWIDKLNMSEKRKMRSTVEAWKQQWNCAFLETDDLELQSLIIGISNSISYRMRDGLSWTQFKKVVGRICDGWI